MYCDLPLFKRCCFCLPLRHGLLAYGYVKLALIVAIAVLLGPNMLHLFFQNIAVMVLALCLLVDIASCVVFIVGGHSKKPQLLKFYMYYTVVTMLIYVALEFTIVAVNSQYLEPADARHLIVSVGFNVVIQLYLVLSIRSEVHKLENPEDDAVHYTPGYNRIVTLNTEKA